MYSFLHFNPKIFTNHEETQLGGELLLGLLTLLTAHHVYAEGQRTKEQPKAFRQPARA